MKLGHFEFRVAEIASNFYLEPFASFDGKPMTSPRYVGKEAPARQQLFLISLCTMVLDIISRKKSAFVLVFLQKLFVY